MTKKKSALFMRIAAAIVLLAAVVLVGSLTACAGGQSREQKLNYAESVEKIDNPDQGFYRPIFVRVTKDGASYNKNIVNSSTRLYHLRIDISSFSAAAGGEDAPLTQAALDGLKSLFEFLKQSDKNAIVRFAYDAYFNGGKDKEPGLQTILKHIEQVCPIIDAYENTVTAVEVGLIGPWGEMHSSAIANKEHITPLIQTFLLNTKSVPVLARTPKMIYDFLGITVKDIDDYAMPKSAYRLGLYNDGYLGSGNDLGTYSDREREIEFLSKQTDHLPFGGEVTIPNSPLHDIEVCLPEMNKINLSYLNIEWNNQVVDKWKNTTYTKACGSDKIYYGKTAFDYIQNHMGYRLVLKKSVFTYSNKKDELKINLALKNVGFGNLNKTKKTEILFVDANGEVAFTHALKDFAGEEVFEDSVKLNLQSGEYKVYLRIYGEKQEGNALYCVQFSNQNIWNIDLKANLIGNLKI